MKKKLTYIGRDDWSRPIYQDETKRICVDTGPRSNHAPGLCTITHCLFNLLGDTNAPKTVVQPA